MIKRDNLMAFVARQSAIVSSVDKRIAFTKNPLDLYADLHLPDTCKHWQQFLLSETRPLCSFVVEGRGRGRQYR